MCSHQTHAFRLTPGQDLKAEIEARVKEKKITAGWVSCCIGSLSQYTIRFANQSGAVEKEGFFEILNLSGTVSENGSHLHVTIADETGNVVGGHLVYGNLIFTTAELVITTVAGISFIRPTDPTTGFGELFIIKNEVPD